MTTPPPIPPGCEPVTVRLLNDRRLWWCEAIRSPESTLTQGKLEKIAGLDQSCISRLLSGEVAVLSWGAFLAIDARVAAEYASRPSLFDGDGT